MRMKLCVAVVVLGCGWVAAMGQAPAATPPMGWNSWDAYGLTITEPQFRANVKVLKTKLAPFGWNYAVIDEGWFFENPQDRGTPEKLHYAIDPHGRYVPVPTRFPSAAIKAAPKQPGPWRENLPYPAGTLAATIENTSFTELGNWVHAQGLKFGIHIVRGIPRASVERNMPMEGSKFYAQDAADTNDACPWDPTNWGVKDNAAGQAWYDSLLMQYAAWGVDLLKVDCIADHPYKVDEIRMIRRAMDKAGRPMVLSLSPGPTDLGHAEEVAQLSNMWRISNDEWDVWDAKGEDFPQGVKDQFARLAAWEKFAKPGTWPDADMLAIGELRPSAGWGAPRTSRLTLEEQKTLITLWSMARSPLVVGANLTLLDDTTLKLLTNKDVIAIDQTSTENAVVSEIGFNKKTGTGPFIEWRAALPDGKVALAFFNLGDTEFYVEQNDGDFTAGTPRTVRDVWTGKDLGKRTSVPVKLPPHGCVLLMLGAVR